MFHDGFFVRSQKKCISATVYLHALGLTLKIKQIEITPELEIKLSVCYETLKSFSDVFCTYLQQKS